MLLDTLHNTLAARPATRPVLEAIERSGGWRTLLDPLSAEWQWTDLGEKRRLLLALRAGGVNLLELTAALVEHFADRDREDIAVTLAEALRDLLPLPKSRRRARRKQACSPRGDEKRAASLCSGRGST